MFSLGSLKYFAIAAIVSSVLGALWYITNLKADLATSEANNELLQIAAEQQSAVIQQQLTDINAVKATNVELSRSVAALQADLDELNNRFEISANGLSRDFGKITRAKPALVNKIINRATDNVNRCFELATGAPLEEGETNSECEALVNTLSN